VGSSAQEGGNTVLIDLRQFDLPLLCANEQELAAHEVLLVDIDKSSKGKTVWRALASA
jgi:DNA polymerase-3 subunit epsilon